MKIKYALLAPLLLSCQGQASAQEINLLEDGNLVVSARVDAFKPEMHKLGKCPGQSSLVCLVDGQVPFGSDLSTPKTELSYIKVKLKGITYNLPVTGMYNPNFDIPSANSKYRFGGFCYNEKSCVFRGSFSQNAGSYAAEWIVSEGTVYRTILTNQADLVHYIEANLKAPRYE